MSSCLAGRLFIVSVAGSWRDLHCRVWGSVWLFLFLGVASCVGSLIPRGRPMLHLDNSDILHILNAGSQYFRRGSVCLDRGKFLKQQLSRSTISGASSCSVFGVAESINTYHADMDISVSVPAFFVPGHTRQVSLS